MLKLVQMLASSFSYLGSCCIFPIWVSPPLHSSLYFIGPIVPPSSGTHSWLEAWKVYSTCFCGWDSLWQLRWPFFWSCCNILGFVNFRLHCQFMFTYYVPNRAERGFGVLNFLPYYHGINLSHTPSKTCNPESLLFSLSSIKNFIQSTVCLRDFLTTCSVLDRFEGLISLIACSKWTPLGLPIWIIIYFPCCVCGCQEFGTYYHIY